MLVYSLREFYDWLLKQPGGEDIVAKLTPYEHHQLHVICCHFMEDVTHEKEALAHDLDTRLSAERAAAHAARESAARKCAADAVAAEVEARAEMIKRGIL